MPDNTELLEVKDKIFKSNKHNIVEYSVYNELTKFGVILYLLNDKPVEVE